MGAIHQALLAIPAPSGGGVVPAVVGQPLIWTGNGTSQSVSGASFSPDLYIGKRRAAVGGDAWRFVDNVRGAGTALFNPSTSGAASEPTGLTSFDANGFSVGAHTAYNDNGNNMLALVLQRVAGAFDIVTYTGTGSTHAENHGLGAVPELIIVKVISGAGTDWIVYPGPLSSPATKNLRLNTTAAAATSGLFWGNTPPTSTEFTVGTSAATNSSGNTLVAYLFASLDPGVKVGSYTGDGNTNGPLISTGATGFKPKFVIIKRTDATGNWIVFDDLRDATSPHNTYSALNLGTTAEQVTTNTAGGLDFLANGFQSVDSAAADINISGATYIFLAVA